MIYSKGTVSVTNGSQVVTGVGSTWNQQTHPGDVLYVDGDSKAYYVAAVVSATELRITETYTGGTVSGVGYVVVSDFTYIKSIPYPKHYDVEKASTLQRSVRLMDKLMDGFHDRILDLEYPAGVVLDITSTPSIDTVFIPGTDTEIDLTGHGIPSAEAFGLPELADPGTLVKADSDVILADSNLVTADASYGGAPPEDEIVAIGIPSAEAFGSAVVQVEGVNAVYPVGIPSEEAFGTPTLALNSATADMDEVTADAYSVTADGKISDFVPLLKTDTSAFTADSSITTDDAHL